MDIMLSVKYNETILQCTYMYSVFLVMSPYEIMIMYLYAFTYYFAKIMYI